jgi:hypothetical protein
MSSHHLFVDCVCNVVDGKVALFLSDLGVENYLKEEIAKFIAQFIWLTVARFLNRLKGLVRFF